MKKVRLVGLYCFILSAVLVSCSNQSAYSTSSARAAYGEHKVVPAKLVKQKKVKVKYSNPPAATSKKRSLFKG